MITGGVQLLTNIEAQGNHFFHFDLYLIGTRSNVIYFQQIINMIYIRTNIFNDNYFRYKQGDNYIR